MSKTYDSSSIVTLRFPESVRSNPSMYIGGTDAHGLFVILRELADNAVDEYLAGRNKFVAIKIDADGSYWVQDGGSGIPQGTKTVEVNVNGKIVKSSMPTMQAVFGELHTSGKFRSDAYAVSIGCFTGDTKIRLLSGKTISFQKLYDRWANNQSPIPIMSFDRKTQKLVPSQISAVQLTKRTRNLVKVKLDDGSFVKCTPEHKFYVNRGGSIVGVQAQKLQQGDSLVSTYYSEDRDGYQKQTQQGKPLKIHRLVAESVTSGGIESYEDVHHVNRNLKDNRPSNLEVIQKSDHQREHAASRSNLSYLKIMTEQGLLRKENSEKFSAQNRDDDFIALSAKVKAVRVGCRAIIRLGVLSEETYEQVRSGNERRFRKALRSFGGNLAEWQAACVKLITRLHSRVSMSSRAEDMLYDLAHKDRVDPKAASANANWIKTVKTWTDILLSFGEPWAVTPAEFNKRTGAVVFGRYANLRRFTSLNRLKSHVLDGEPLVLFDDQTQAAQDQRMMEAEFKMRAPEAMRKLAKAFLSSCKRASHLNECEYSQAKAASAPSWAWGNFIVRKIYGEDVTLSELVAAYNHEVVGIQHIKLNNEVPVYDMTVDNTHVFFIEPGVLVANSHGVGVKGTNATSEFFDVLTCYKGKWFKIGFKKGKLSTPLAPSKAPVSPFSGKPLSKGTLVHFKPDASIFSVKSFPPMMLVEWAEVQAYLNPGLQVAVSIKGKQKSWLSKEGPKEYIAKRLTALKAEAEPDMFEFRGDLAHAVVAFSNADGFELRGYTNGLANSQGGKHVDSVAAALYKAVQAYKGAKQEFSAADFRDGMVGIVNAKLHKAAFSSQDKAKLTDDRMGKDFEEMVFAVAKKFFASNKAMAKRLCDRASKINELKTKFKASKAVATELNKVKRQGLPPNYAPAHRSVPIAERELFVVEGDSAAGGLRKVRQRHQALLPLKGKILNCIKAKGDKALLSQAVLSILGALGFDPKQADPLKKLQIGKIIFLADADPDGSHINCLLHVLIARYLPGMYDAGMVYVADMPEFYSIVKDQIFTGDKLSEVQAKLKKAKLKGDVLHAKGWGEVDPQVLKILAVDNSRRLIKINPLTDEDKTKFFGLMGKGEAPANESEE